MSQYEAYESASTLANTTLAVGGAFAIIYLVIMLISFVLTIVTLVALAKIYKKLGLHWWAVLVPFYGPWVFFKAMDLPGWLSILPVANILALIVVNYRLAGKFGKGAGFGLGLVFFTSIFYMILGFGDATVVGSDNAGDVQFDLMANDPNEGGELNLMTPDPISDIPSEPEEVKGFDLEEKPSLAEQITAEPVKIETLDSTPEVLDIPVANDTSASDNIFASEEVSAGPAPINEPSYNDNIFEMPAFKSDVAEEKKPEEIFNSPQFENTISIDKISNPEMPTAEVEMPRVSSDAIAEEFINNSKICPNCGYSNGGSIKACVKCGHLLD